MYPTKGMKTVVGLLGTGVTAGATVTSNIDCLGYEHAMITLAMGTADVVSNKPSVLKISESDTTDATNFSDVTAGVGGGAGGFTIPNADTVNANVYQIDVDTRARKRYLKLTVSPRTTQQTVIMTKLSRAEQTPQTTTAQGVHALVHV